MKNAIAPDTDVLIDFLRGQPEAVAYISTNADRIVLSAVVIAELYAGVKGDREMAVLDQFIQDFPTAPVTAEIGKSAGLYKRQYGKSHGLELGDALLAATAQSELAELKTLNVRHYPMFTGLKPAYRKP